MNVLLASLTSEARAIAWSRYLDAAEAFRGIAMADRPYGHLLTDHPIETARWPDFFKASIRTQVAMKRAAMTERFGAIESLIAAADALFDSIPAEPAKVLVHGDMFPANVLLDADLTVTGVVDFGTWTLTGSATYELASAAMFCETVDGITENDIDQLHRDLLRRVGPAALPELDAYRAYFGFTLFDPTAVDGPYPGLHPWAVGILDSLIDRTISQWADRSA